MNTLSLPPFEKNSLGEFIPRQYAGFPDHFMPQITGGFEPPSEDLQAAGYRTGMRRPRGWKRKHADVFYKEVGDHTLWVRGTTEAKTKLWVSEREGISNDDDQILTHSMCDLPILNRTYHAAMWLAEFCHPHVPNDRGHLYWADAEDAP